MASKKQIKNKRRISNGVNFHIITLFPEAVRPYLEASILGRAEKSGKLKISYYNPRDFTRDKHRKVDGRTFGGGPGMTMKAEPVLRAVKKAKGRKKDVKIVLFSPSGKEFTDTLARRYVTKYRHIIFVCGRYEGVDARVKKALGAEELSIGPYVLTGGELPAMAIVDAMTRKIPGVLGNAESLEEARVASPEMYTRPEVFEYEKKKYRVPKVLLSGNHKDIETWRKKKRGV